MRPKTPVATPQIIAASPTSCPHPPWRISIKASVKNNPVSASMNPKSIYCLIRITSRSGLGASPRIRSTSPRLCATWRAIPESEMPRGGRDALVKEGFPASRANMTSASTAKPAATRSILGRSSLGKDTGGIARKVRQDNIGPGTPDGCERFHHGALIFQPAPLYGRHQHAELPRHLVSGDRHRKLLASLPDQVEIRQRRLDHQH